MVAKKPITFAKKEIMRVGVYIRTGARTRALQIFTFLQCSAIPAPLPPHPNQPTHARNSSHARAHSPLENELARRYSREVVAHDRMFETLTAARSVRSRAATARRRMRRNVRLWRDCASQK